VQPGFLLTASGCTPARHGAPPPCSPPPEQSTGPRAGACKVLRQGVTQGGEGVCRAARAAVLRENAGALLREHPLPAALTSGTALGYACRAAAAGGPLSARLWGRVLARRQRADGSAVWRTLLKPGGSLSGGARACRLCKWKASGRRPGTARRRGQARAWTTGATPRTTQTSRARSSASPWCGRTGRCSGTEQLGKLWHAQRLLSAAHCKSGACCASERRLAVSRPPRRY